jgi:hypothetical protein
MSDFEKLDDLEFAGGENVIVFHGFSKEKLSKVMEAVKKVSDGDDVIMAVSTPTSLEWKLKDLIEELTKEHQYFKTVKKTS